MAWQIHVAYNTQSETQTKNTPDGTMYGVAKFVIFLERGPGEAVKETPSSEYQHDFVGLLLLLSSCGSLRENNTNNTCTSLSEATRHTYDIILYELCIYVYILFTLTKYEV